MPSVHQVDPDDLGQPIVLASSDRSPQRRNRGSRLLPLLGATAVCAVIVVTGSMAANAKVGSESRSNPAGAADPSAAAVNVQSGSPNVPDPSRAKPGNTAGSPAAPAPLGDVIVSGVTDACGERVLWFEGLSQPRPAQIQFGLIAGCRSVSGQLTSLVETNEVEGADDAPGFHAVEGVERVGGDNVLVPEFGYYAGAAVKITGKRNGHVVQAHQATWSRNSGIVAFWFDADSTADATGLTAFDAAGNQLPTGNATVSHG